MSISRVTNRQLAIEAMLRGVALVPESVLERLAVIAGEEPWDLTWDWAAEGADRLAPTPQAPALSIRRTLYGRR